VCSWHRKGAVIVMSVCRKYFEQLEDDVKERYNTILNRKWMILILTVLDYDDVTNIENLAIPLLSTKVSLLPRELQVL